MSITNIRTVRTRGFGLTFGIHGSVRENEKSWVA